VAVANGDQISNVGIYNSLPIRIDTEQFIIDCYNIQLGGYDFVLGVNWLSSLGPIIWDFNNLKMKFWRNGRRIIWTSLNKPSEQPRLHTLSAPDSMENVLQAFSQLFPGASRVSTKKKI
jgi:hypothetical protein